MRFYATLQLRTPLRVLSRHGELHRERFSPPPTVTQAEGEGIWLPGIEGLGPPGFESIFASDVGYVKERAYLPFLLAIPDDRGGLLEHGHTPTLAC
jgi:hypothetical protein